MSTFQSSEEIAVGSEGSPEGPKNKKEQILTLFASGITQLEEIAALVQTRMSYVAAVLKKAGHLPAYYDLYTSIGPMNAYSKHFRGRVGFKDVSTAHKSVEFLENLYRKFEMVRDRAGQHHVLMEALILFNRARWIGKLNEAQVFASFLQQRIGEMPNDLIH